MLVYISDGCPLANVNWFYRGKYKSTRPKKMYDIKESIFSVYIELLIYCNVSKVLGERFAYILELYFIEKKSQCYKT